MSKIGIYKITNVVTSQVYVGSSTNLNIRKTQHFNRLHKKTHVNKKLQNSWNKYGPENFVFEILELCDLENLQFTEQKFIDALGAFDKGFNLVKLAGQGTSGYSHTEESKRRMSIAKAGVKLPRTEEHQAKLTNSQIGREVSIETRAKIAAKLKGKKPSEETRAKLREAAKTKVHSPRSEEAKKNMSIAQKKRFAQKTESLNE